MFKSGLRFSAFLVVMEKRYLPGSCLRSLPPCLLASFAMTSLAGRSVTTRQWPTVPRSHSSIEKRHTDSILIKCCFLVYLLFPFWACVDIVYTN